MALNENKYNHLEELGGSDYEIVDGEPNIKGWDVKTEQGEKIGEVDELLFDPQSRKVRYIIVDLNDNVLSLDEDKKVLVPIGVAQLYSDDYEDDTTGNDGIENGLADSGYTGEADNENSIYSAGRDGDVVIVPVTAEQLKELPAYKKDGVTPETESAVRRIFEGLGAAGLAAGAAGYNKEDFYTHDHFNEDKFYDRGTTNTLPVIEENLEVGKRDVQTGGARITSRIVERPVEERINLREEHVNVERTPVDRVISGTDVNAFKEEEFELTERAEVPVVNKEARVVEEISLNKEVEEREETIKDTLRNTEVTEEKIDPDKKSY